MVLPTETPAFTLVFYLFVSRVRWSLMVHFHRTPYIIRHSAVSNRTFWINGSLNLCYLSPYPYRITYAIASSLRKSSWGCKLPLLLRRRARRESISHERAGKFWYFDKSTVRNVVMWSLSPWLEFLCFVDFFHFEIEILKVLFFNYFIILFFVSKSVARQVAGFPNKIIIIFYWGLSLF